MVKLQVKPNTLTDASIDDNTDTSPVTRRPVSAKLGDKQEAKGHVDNSDDDTVALQRTVGMFSAIGMIMGSIIGSGVFLAPVAIVRHCNSVGLSLVIWVISGGFSIMKAMCFVELGLLFPRAGGEYAYMREINGETLAFLNAYVTLFAARPCIIAMLTKITIDYFIDAFVPACEMNPLVKDILGIWLIMTIVAINTMPMDKVVIVQNILGYLKLAAIAIIIAIGLVHIAKGNTENFKDPFKNSTFKLTNISVAIFIGIYCYDGWQGIYDLMEDIKNPKKVAPISSTVSILAAVLIFLGTNVAYFSTMTPDEMSRSSSVALSFAKVTMGSYSRVIPLLVAGSTVGALNGCILRSSRILFAQGRDGIFPNAVCMLNIKYKVPWIASWLICSLSCVYIFVFDVFELFDYLNFTSFLFKVLLYGNVIILRYTRPNLHRPFKVNLLIPAFVVMLIIVMAVSGAILSPFNFLTSQVLVAMGLPLYACVRYSNTHPHFLLGFKYKFNSTLQKLLLMVPPEN